MKVYEKIKEMSFDELIDFLSMLDADANFIYCRYLCNSKIACDESGSIPCPGVNELRELLNADYGLIIDYANTWQQDSKDTARG